MTIFDFSKRSREQKTIGHEIQRLMADLKHPDSDVRMAAGNSLGEMPAVVVPLLIPLLNDPHSGVRAGVAFALSKIGDASAVEPIIRTLQDENADVRAVAAAALGRLQDPRAIPALARALSDPDNGVRFLSIGSLNSIGGKQVVAALIKAVKDDDQKNRVTAIACLAKINDVQAVEPLIEALKDQEKEVRTIAIVALKEIGDNRAVEPLIEVLTGGPDHQEVLENAIIALGEIGDLRAVAPLLAALRTDYPNLRAEAAKALGKQADPSAVEPLIQGLRDEYASVRFYSAQALGELGDERAVLPLSQVLQDKNDDVCNAARGALAKLGCPTPAAIQARVKAMEAQRVEVSSAAAPAVGGKPTFLSKEQRGESTYEKHQAADAETAKAFLLKKKVDRPRYYVIVETPNEGIWGMDKDGLYLVHLLDWQKDLSLGDCEGQIVEEPQEMSLAYAATDRADNFIAKVCCGKCGQEWLDGHRYQHTTIMRCPKCKALNKVDSRDIIYLGFDGPNPSILS